MLGTLDYIYQNSDHRLRRAMAKASRLCRFLPFLPSRLRVGGFDMVLDQTDAAYFRYRRHRGNYEAAEVAFTLDSIRRNFTSIFVDVGASYGFYTLSVADLAKDTGGVERIYAIEPDPRPVRALRCALDLNDFSDIAEVHQAAVGNFVGKTQIAKHPYASTGNQAFVSPNHQEKDYEVEDVDVITLDTLLTEHLGGDKRFVLKIDAEGAEVQVLQGAARVLSDAAGYIVIVEYHPAGVKARGFTSDDFIDIIEAAKPEINFRLPRENADRALHNVVNDIDSEVGASGSHSRKLCFARGMRI